MSRDAAGIVRNVSVFFGAHVSASGGIHTTLDRAEAMRADAVQLFTQSPRMWRPTNHDPANFETFKERRAELGIAAGGVLAHALYLVNLAAPDDEIHKKSRAALRNTMEVACAIDADGVVFHVGSHLGAGHGGRHEAVRAGAQGGARALHRHDVAADGGLRRRGRDDRTLDRRARAALRRVRRATSASASASTRATSTSRASTSRSARSSTICSTSSTSAIGLDRLRALHVNDARDPLGSNRDRHANIGEGVLGSKLGVFLSHPKLQGLPAFLEVPGADKHGPDAKRAEEGPQTCTSGGAELPLADPRRGDARVDEPVRGADRHQRDRARDPHGTTS